jgi:drug/metabolite transporter (DMT)-like permease
MYTGIFVTAIGYFLFLKAIDLSVPCTASMTFFVKPIFAPLVAFFVLGESISIRLVFGILFVLAGSFVNLFGDKIRKKTAI